MPPFSPTGCQRLKLQDKCFGRLNMFIQAVHVIFTYIKLM